MDVAETPHRAATHGRFAVNDAAVAVHHLTGNTPRTPVAPCAGQAVSLWFGVRSTQPDINLYLVIENDGDPEEMPRVVKATRKCEKSGGSYWHYEIGPFDEGDTVAYFAAGDRGGREIICGSQHWFRVLPAYLAAEQLTGKGGDP